MDGDRREYCEVGDCEMIAKLRESFGHLEMYGKGLDTGKLQ